MLRRIVFGCCLTLLLAACGGTLAPIEERHASERIATAAPLLPGYYQVQRGDTLYSIAFQYSYSFQQIATWNHIEAPYRIYHGQRLRVMPPGVETPSTIRILPSEAGPMMQPSAPLPLTTDKFPNGPLRWAWPTQGGLLHGFDPEQPGGKGVDIRGRLGQSVNAAANGWVVYSGNGLIGYGQLLIVKHDKSVLSAYGHNRRLLVKEGDAVHVGQAIAEMGLNGGSGPMLHFEIRVDGKPIDPLRYLPRQ